MEKCRSLNQALRRLDYKLGVEKLQGDQFCELLRASSYWTPWAAMDSSSLPGQDKRKLFPCGKCHMVQTPARALLWMPARRAARVVRCPGSAERCAGALCWAGLKVLTFAVTFFFTTNWHKSCCTSSVGHPAWGVTPAHGGVSGSSWSWFHFTFSAVSCNCSCVGALEIPEQCWRV